MTFFNCSSKFGQNLLVLQKNYCTTTTREKTFVVIIDDEDFLGDFFPFRPNLGPTLHHNGLIVTMLIADPDQQQADFDFQMICDLGVESHFTTSIVKEVVHSATGRGPIGEIAKNERQV